MTVWCSALSASSAALIFTVTPKDAWNRSFTYGHLRAASGGTSDRPVAGRDGSGIKRQDPDRGRQWRRQQAEKREKAEREALPLTPEARAGNDRFRLAMRLGGTYDRATRLIAAWDAGEIEEG